jgi:TolB protein
MMFKSFAIVGGMLGASLVAWAGPLLSTEPPPVLALPLQDPQTPPRQTELVLTLTNPGSHPRIGMQDFSTATPDPALREAARTVAAVLWNDLEYEREFYMISTKSSAGIAPAATPQALQFEQWTQLGADFVLMGHVRDAGGGRLAVEIRLIGTRGETAGRQEFGQSYQGCTLANPRYCAHSVADDMHKQIRALDGVARTRIVFTSDRDTERMTGRPLQDSGQGKEIYLMDYDGANQRRVTVNRSLNIGPAWGPDGRTLAYASYSSRYPDIYVTQLDGRAPTRPAQGTEVVHNQNPAFSPDGNRIAFTSNRGGQTGFYDVWVVNRDGSNLQNLTPGTPRSSEGAPTWSPGGNQIAFTSDRTGTNHIYVMNADGTGVRRITQDQKSDRPAWSMLNYIAYTMERPGGHDIALTDLTRMEPRVLTDGLGSNKQPTVSANGRHVAFVTTRWGKEHIATVDIDGKNYRRLTEVGNNTYPNWSPAPGVR